MKKFIPVLVALLTSISIYGSGRVMPKPLIAAKQGVISIFTPVLHSDSSIILSDLVDIYRTGNLTVNVVKDHADSIKILTSLYSIVTPRLVDIVDVNSFANMSPIPNRTDSLRLVTSTYSKVTAKLYGVISEHDSLAQATRQQDLKLFAFAYGMVSPNISLHLQKHDSLRRVEVARIEALKQQFKFMGLDSLKHQLKINTIESLKLPLYSEIAARYLDYDTITNKHTRLSYQNEALSYTMMVLHYYSKTNDAVGLRTSFDNLAKVYFAQKKYSQAKWFILQSNTLSRNKKDTSNIITSLVTLAEIKTDIKDYALATRDLNEALTLSIKSKALKVESGVLKSFAMLYSKTKDYTKESAMIKKRDSLEDKIHKNEEAQLLAKVAAQDSAQVKKLDSLQNKKKVYTSATKKLYKNNSSRKIASL